MAPSASWPPTLPSTGEDESQEVREPWNVTANVLSRDRFLVHHLTAEQQGYGAGVSLLKFT